MQFVPSSIPGAILEETGKFAQRMNRIRQTPGWYVYPTIQLSSKDLYTAAKDLLRIKEIICGLPQLLNLSHRDFLSKLGESSNLLDFSKNESLEWKSSFFRPDCILTSQGLKILEMNIDNGSMAMYGGMALKSFYKMQSLLPKYINSVGGVAIDETLDIENNLFQYFKNIQDCGKRIYFWDLALRSEAVRTERDREIAYLRNKGIEISLVLGKEILHVPANGDSYVFRYFAYPHIFKKNSDLPEIFSEIPGILFKNGDLGGTSSLYDHKVNLALLWNHKVQSQLSLKDVELIQKYIPESYFVDDLLPKLTDRTDWVLKQGIGFQGAQVLLGSDCSQEEWDIALSEAKIKSGFVLQKKVQALSLQARATDGYSSKYVGQNHVLNMFFVDNKFCGSWFRLASNAQGKVGAIDSENILGVLPIVAE